MSSSSLTREEAIARATEEFDQQQRFEEAEKKSRSEFASKVLTGLRYPETAELHQQSDFAPIYDSLGEHEIRHLTLLRKQHGENIHSIVLAPNKSTKDLGSFVVSFKPDAQVSNLYDAIDTKAPFAHTLFVPIEGSTSGDISTLSEKQFRAKYNEVIRDRLSEFPHDSPSVFEHYAPSRTSHRDLKEWDTFLPSKKATVGVYHHDGRFFLVVNSHAGSSAVSDLNAILSSPGMTIGAFESDPRVGWIRNMSYRNCARLLHDVAHKAGLIVPCGNDTRAFLHPYKKQCRMVHPVHFNVHNTLGRDTSKNVVCYHRCSNALQGTSGILLTSNPYHGYVHINPSGPRPCDVNFFPRFTSRLCKEKRVQVKPTLQKKCFKRIHYVHATKRSRTCFSHEVYSSSFFGRISRFFGLPQKSAERFIPVYVYHA